MINPREQGLIELIKDKIIGIQKSRQINEQISKLDKKLIKMNRKEVDSLSELVASKVHKYCMRVKSSGKLLTGDMINVRVKKELEKG